MRDEIVVDPYIYPDENIDQLDIEDAEGCAVGEVRREWTLYVTIAGD